MKQFLLFCLAGTLGYGTDLTVLLLVSPFTGPYIAKAIAFFIAVQVTFLFNKTFTFSTSANPWLRYVVGQIKGFAVNWLIFTLSMVMLPFEGTYRLVAASVAASLAALVFNFFYAKFIVFQRS